jgi:glutaminyl-peptide cyclotransferase
MMMARLSGILQLSLCLLSITFVQAYKPLSDDALHAIPTPGEDFNIKTGRLLAPILRPRVPGTVGSAEVLNHLVDFFKTSLPKWTISLQNSTSKTPATGDEDIPFVNVIASRDPPWTSPGEVGRLTLVAHYDSKLTPSGFIGATDSAAPCAMLMHAARSVDGALTKKWGTRLAGGGAQDHLGIDDHQGVQMIFLDGEEAFLSWTNEDSLYGARSLAAEMEATPHPALSTYQTAISSISLFVLLDLLGEKNPRVPSFFETTHWAYRHMATLENRLRKLSLFASARDDSSKRAIQGQTKGRTRSVKQKRKDSAFLFDSDKKDHSFSTGTILDDHVPFMARGVEVLHIIPMPFPAVWHKIEDDGEHLDLDTCADWAVLVTAFIGEWMELDGLFEKASTAVEGARERRSVGEGVGKTEL